MCVSGIGGAFGQVAYDCGPYPNPDSGWEDIKPNDSGIGGDLCERYFLPWVSLNRGDNSINNPPAKMSNERGPE